jgi:hypothetical protein
MALNFDELVPDTSTDEAKLVCVLIADSVPATPEYIGSVEPANINNAALAKALGWLINIAPQCARDMELTGDQADFREWLGEQHSGGRCPETVVRRYAKKIAFRARPGPQQSALIHSSKDLACWYEQLLRDCGARELNATDYLVGVVVGRHVNKKSGTAWPGMETLAKDTGVSLRHVKRCIPKLESRGHLRTSNSKPMIMTPLLWTGKR